MDLPDDDGQQLILITADQDTPPTPHYVCSHNSDRQALPSRAARVPTSHDEVRGVYADFDFSDEVMAEVG